MQKRMPYHVASLFLVAVFITAGCAKQGDIKKDEGIAPAPAARQADPPKLIQDDSSTPAPTQTTTNTTTQVAPSTAPSGIVQKPSSSRELQSSLDKIYFNFDSAGLSESARSTLTKNAAILMKEPAAIISIEGNCDERGSAEYNLALGERRAKAAHQYLVTMGVEPARLATVSYGNEKPADRGNDEAGWAKNRRAEFVVVTR